MNDDHDLQESGYVSHDESTARLPLVSGNPSTADRGDQYPYTNDPPEYSPDDDDEWPVRTASKGIRVPLLAVILLVLLVGFGGIWGGAALQRSQNTSGSSTLASAFARFRSGASGAASGSRGSAFPASGGFFGGGQAGSGTSGTVTVIDGNTLYITDASGGIVKVIIGSSTKVTRDAVSTPASLQPGDTVTIQGSKSANGTVNATSISATAATITAGSGNGTASSGASGGGTGFAGASGG